MRRVAAAIVIPVMLAWAVASPARADRPAYFPTLGVNLVVHDEQPLSVNAWLGLAYRSKGTGWRGFYAVGADLAFHADGVDVAPVARVGTSYFHQRRDWLPVFSAYGLGGISVVRDAKGRPDRAVRAGVGITIPPMLLVCEGGYCLPNQLDLVVDVTSRMAQGVVRFGWAF